MANILWHNLFAEEAIETLKAHPIHGLTEKEAKSRMDEFGKNELPEERSMTRLELFVEQFKSPLIYILVIAGFITLLFENFTDSIVIFGAVILNTIVSYVQESKASKALKELKKAVRHEAKIIRDGNAQIVDSSELVSGDIFVLGPGDRVPADGRIIEASDLKVNEMALTGEWAPAQKTTNILEKDTPLADRDNMVYMGTIVEDGKAKAVAANTGAESELGKISQMVKEAKEEKTPLQKKISNLSRTIGGVIILVTLFIFIEGIATGNTYLEMFETSVALAVAAIPEGLPVAMTVVLALGMHRILKKKGLVRKLVAAEALGNTSIIATDKTRTLTEGRMEVAELFTLDKKKDNEALILKTIALYADPFVKSPTEKALLAYALMKKVSKKKIEKKEERISELPFDSVKKYGSVLYRKSKNKYIAYTVGAPEKLLAASVLSPKKKKEADRKLKQLAQKGFRVVAFGFKEIKKEELPKNPKKIRAKILEKEIRDINFAGMVALRDPLRKDAKKSIKICMQAGMKPIIVTGDHKLTAKSVANEIGLKAEEENILEGKDLEGMSDEKLEKCLDKINVYARVEPKHKMRIIEAWQRRGEVVAMIGDGINDAPALKKADIGVAIGSGTEVAKEISDLVLLSDNFNVVVAAVEEGRVILDNIRKILTYLLSDTFSEIVLIAGALLMGFPLPIIPAQILWINLVGAGLPNVALAFEPKEKDIMKQKSRGRKAPLLTGEMKVIIFIIGLTTDVLLLILYCWFLQYDFDIVYVRTMIFATLAINSMFFVYSCKSLRKNIWKINPFSNKVLVWSTVAGMGMLLVAIYAPPLQALLKTVPLGMTELGLGWLDWGIIVFSGITNILLIEATKWYFIYKKVL